VISLGVHVIVSRAADHLTELAAMEGRGSSEEKEVFFILLLFLFFFYFFFPESDSRVLDF
jgi:hypothetical protein